MRIINLTQTQYRNYSNIHSKRNFGQTIEYSLLEANHKKQKLFLGLIDDQNNLHAATLLLVENISPTIKEAISPNGFLIDYSNQYYFPEALWYFYTYHLGIYNQIQLVANIIHIHPLLFFRQENI